MRVVPFDVVIPADEQDVHLAERLRVEADAILTFAVEGYRNYEIRKGLDEPESVRLATGDYQKASDAIARFIDECCLINPHMHMKTADAHDRYSRWAVQDGAEPMTPKAFGQALDRRSFPAGPGGRAGRLRRGIGLQGEDDG